MKIVMDEKIPFLRDAFLGMGYRVVALPGSAIGKDDVRDADAMFVRTRTKCDEALLDGTSVRFIGTATIGYDHIDTEYCSRCGIEWANAPGCNADAVLQYVQSVIYSWAADCKRSLQGLTMGIVGVGAIGSRVARWAESVGLNVLLNDPPRSSRGEDGFVSLDRIAAECDIITFHPILSVDGPFPTYHLADEAFFRSLRKCPFLINASRGAVVDNNALVAVLEQGILCDVALDVWEGEPEISRVLLNEAYVATPHIAGYSAEGKLNATKMMLEAFARFSGYANPIPQLSLPAPESRVVYASCEGDAFLKIYSPHEDTRRLKSSPDSFEAQRNNYLLRREYSSYEIVIDKNNKV